MDNPRPHARVPDRAVTEEAAYALSLVVGVTAHELGHAGVVWALGGRVDSITVGGGPRLLALRARSVTLVVRLLPFSGLTVWRGRPADQRGSRLAVALAGCAVNLLCAVGALLLAGPSPGRTGFVLANASLGLYNLLPVAGLGGGSMDGLVAWRLLRGEGTLSLSDQAAVAARDPSSAAARSLRERLRPLVDHHRDLGAARLLAGLPGGEPGRAARPATEDLERIRLLAVDERLPAAQRAVLAYLVATTGLPGLSAGQAPLHPTPLHPTPLDPTPLDPTPLDPAELAWCASLLALASELAPQTWQVTAGYAQALALQALTRRDAAAGRRAGQLAARAAQQAASAGQLAAADTARLEATAALAACAAGDLDEARRHQRACAAADPRCPGLALLDQVLADLR